MKRILTILPILPIFMIFSPISIESAQDKAAAESEKYKVLLEIAKIDELLEKASDYGEKLEDLTKSRDKALQTQFKLVRESLLLTENVLTKCPELPKRLAKDFKELFEHNNGPKKMKVFKTERKNIFNVHTGDFNTTKGVLKNMTEFNENFQDMKILAEKQMGKQVEAISGVLSEIRVKIENFDKNDKKSSTIEIIDEFTDRAKELKKHEEFFNNIKKSDRKVLGEFDEFEKEMGNLKEKSIKCGVSVKLWEKLRDTMKLIKTKSDYDQVSKMISNAPEEVKKMKEKMGSSAKTEL